MLDEEKIDVYPVGLFMDVRNLRGLWRHKRSGEPGSPLEVSFWRSVRRRLGYPLRQMRAGEWRAVRMYFNGYLAEPTPWPDGLVRCGSGWTKHRAIASLRRQLAVDLGAVTHG